MWGYNDIMYKPGSKRQYYLDNKERIDKQQREYALKNKEKIKAKSKKWYKNNKEKQKAYTKRYYKEHPEICLKSNLKQFKMIGNIFNLTSEKYMWALISWSRAVKKDKSCVICGSKNNLNAHHLFYKNLYPKLSLNINNGITLCKKHHNETHGKELNICNELTI